MAKQTLLTPEKIISVAIELLDRGGLKNFSMRKLAAEFGVDPMAIYYHIPNRAALMSLVVDSVVSQCELPQADMPWQETCKAICHSFRKLAYRHPGVIQVFDNFEDWVPAEHRISEAFHKALISAGFDDQLTVRAARLLMAYTENFCAWELNDWIAPYTAEMRSELVDSLTQGEFPLTIGLVEEVVNVDPDAEFEFGLEVMLRGLETASLRST